jgi:hypothetical protein
MADDDKPVVEVSGYKLYLNAGRLPTGLRRGLETYKIVRPDGSVLVDEISRADAGQCIRLDMEQQKPPGR